jgi:hypothetical protein
MREHFSHPGGMVSMIGCVIDGAIGLDQNGELVAVDGQERQNFIEQRVVKGDLAHRFWMRTYRSYLTLADQGFGKGLGVFFALNEGSIHGGDCY